MPISYENRKGETHYVRTAITKKGGKRYYIVKNKAKYKPEELLDEMPVGFEFYEFPSDGLVAFRHILKSSFTDEEYTGIDSVMRNHKTVRDYIIDKEENALMIYIDRMDQELIEMLGEEQIRQIKHYDDILRFEKNKNEIYAVQRFCYISRYYGWITMETNLDLRYLAEKYCYHIDKESLLQFWIEGEEDW